MFKGLTRGVDLIVQFFVILWFAIEQAVKDTPNLTPLQDCKPVISTWWKEATGVSILAQGAFSKKSNLNYFALLTGSDPFAGSRALLQILAQKYPLK